MKVHIEPHWRTPRAPLYRLEARDPADGADEWCAIDEADSLAQAERLSAAILRNTPGIEIRIVANMDGAA